MGDTKNIDYVQQWCQNYYTEKKILLNQQNWSVTECNSQMLLIKHNT